MTKVDFKLLDTCDTEGIYIDLRESIMRFMGRKAWGEFLPETMEAKAKLEKAEGNLEVLTDAELDALFTGAWQVMTRELDAMYQHVCEKQCNALRQQIKIIKASRLNTH